MTEQAGVTTPVTDRPLTAEDGWIEWHGGENPVPGERVYARFRDEYEPPHTTPSEEWDWSHNSPDRRIAKGADDIIAYRLARPPSVSAGPVGGVTSDAGPAAEFWANVETGAGGVTSEAGEAWEPVAEAMCAEIIKRAEVTCRKATDELYEGLLYSVQDYLRENVMLNLSGELDRAHGYERDARAALVEIAKASGVAFVDSRDGVERQKERILAALTRTTGEG